MTDGKEVEGAGAPVTVERLVIDPYWQEIITGKDNYDGIARLIKNIESSEQTAELLIMFGESMRGINHDTVEILRQGRTQLVLDAMRRSYDMFAMLDTCREEGEELFDTVVRLCDRYKSDVG